VLLWRLDGTARDDLWVEVGKGLIQVVVIGVLGTLLKRLLDDYQADRQEGERKAAEEREAAERAAAEQRQAAERLAAEQRRANERRDQFRTNKIRRLVAATNVIRRAPIVIEADRSESRWSEQMLAIIDAGFDLRVIRHEISASTSAPEPPFKAEGTSLILKELDTMIKFVEWVGRDYAQAKHQISELERGVDEQQLPADERAARMWEAIRSQRPVKEMIERPAASSEDAAESFQRYLDAYEQAMDYMVREALGSPPEPTSGAPPDVRGPGHVLERPSSEVDHSTPQLG
jgi:3-methyladenine DNA glycosylase/8-oxoguanine DNA glycosylase